MVGGFCSISEILLDSYKKPVLRGSGVEEADNAASNRSQAHLLRLLRLLRVPLRVLRSLGSVQVGSTFGNDYAGLGVCAGKKGVAFVDTVCY